MPHRVSSHGQQDIDTINGNSEEADIVVDPGSDCATPWVTPLKMWSVSLAVSTCHTSNHGGSLRIHTGKPNIPYPRAFLQ